MELIINETNAGRKYIDVDTFEVAKDDDIIRVDNIDTDANTNILIDILLAKYHLKEPQRQIIYKILDKYHVNYLEGSEFEAIDKVILCQQCQAKYNKSIRTYERAIDLLIYKGLIHKNILDNGIKLADKLNIFRLSNIYDGKYLVIKLKPDNIKPLL